MLKSRQKTPLVKVHISLLMLTFFSIFSLLLLESNVLKNVKLLKKYGTTFLLQCLLG